MPWDLGANLLAGVRTGLDIGQTQQANALRQQAAAQSQYEMYRQAVKDAETRAGKIIQAALPMLDTTDDASLQRSWASVMPRVRQQLEAEGLMQIEPVSMQFMAIDDGVKSGRDVSNFRSSVMKYQQMLGAGPQAPAKGTPEYLKAFEEEQRIKQQYATPKGPVRGSPEDLEYQRKLKEQELQLKQKYPTADRPYHQYVGLDEKGNPITFNARTGQFESRDETGRINPKPSPIPATEQQAIEQFNMLTKMGETIRTSYRDDWVGPVYGTVQKKKGEYVDIPEEQAAFYTALDSLGNILVYLRSGKQINEMEYKRLKLEMPRANYPPNKFRANYNNFIDQLTAILSVKTTALQRRGIDPQAILRSIPGKLGTESQPTAAPAPTQRTVVRTGKDKTTGKKVIEYSDGSIEYATD